MKKRKSNILSIVPKLEQKKAEQEAGSYTVQGALEEALRDVKDENGEEEYNAFKGATKLMVIALDDSNGMYITGFIQSGFRMSECIALMELMKIRFMQHMDKV
jgi:hypothetical protein